MPYPNIYGVTFSYGSVPPGAELPGTQLEADFAGLHDSIFSVSEFVKSVIRADGALNNGIVTFNSLSPGLQFSAGGAISDFLVSGPNGVTDGTPAVFDGPTGRLVKNVTFASFKASLVLVKADVGLGNVDNTTDASKPVSTAQATALALKADLSALGTAAVKNVGLAAGNVPLLDGSGLLDTAVLPAIAVTDVSVVASQVAMLALVAQKGDIAIRSDLNKSFALSTNSPSTLADWKELLTPTDAVLSVAALTGAISAAALKTALALVKGDVGLGNVANLDTSTQTNVNFVGLGAAAAVADADTLPVNQGAGNLKQTFAAIKTWIKSWIAVTDLNDVAWTVYTPSSAFSAPGTSVMGGANGRWKKIGKVVYFTVDCTVTTVGTASGNWVIGLPTATNATSTGQTVGATGKEVVTSGALLAIQGFSTTTVAVNKYDNTGLALLGNGTRVIFAGFYEAA